MKAKQKLHEMEAELQAASEEIKARKEEEGKVATGKKSVTLIYLIVLLLTIFHFVENRYSHQGEKSQAHLDTLPEELAYSLDIVACIKLIKFVTICIP